MKYEIGIVDDHHLISTSLALMVETFEDFTVSFEVQSGLVLQQRMLTLQKPPDIVLVDVTMPDMSGQIVAQWLTEKYPSVKIAALSVKESEHAMRSMLKAGCCTYLLKSTHPAEFEKALTAIIRDGEYHAGSYMNFRRLISSYKDDSHFSEQELKFIQHASSDHTY